MSEVCVAIVRIRPEALAQLDANKQKSATFLGAAAFDVLMAVPPPPLLAAGPSCSSQVHIAEHQALALPRFRCKVRTESAAGEAALRFARALSGTERALPLSRAIPVPLCNLGADHQQQSQSPLLAAGCSTSQSPQLVVVPATCAQCPSERLGAALEFRSLATVLHAALHFDASLVEPHSQNVLVRIGEWLSERQSWAGTAFLDHLFTLAPASARLVHCVHNPACSPGVLKSCQKVLQSEDKENAAACGRRSCELGEAAKRSNAVRAQLLRLEKYNQCVINPLFGTNLRRPRGAPVLEYFVRGRQASVETAAERHRRCSSTGSGGAAQQQQRSPTEFWEQQYPLHKHAFDGNAGAIRALLAQGYDANEQDSDLWTPLHYCAFYNRLEATEVLLLHARCNVNVQNGTGASPLHFAALNGHVYVAELLLSHQRADVSLRDRSGKTALDLCAQVPKSDWQGVARLLERSASERPLKMEVQLAGGASLQVEVEDAASATAGELRAKVLALEGLDPDIGARIFAIWLVDSRLSLQLKAEQKVNVHLEKWAEHLDKFGGGVVDSAEEAEAGGASAAERPRVVLRRDARTLLGDEQALAKKSPVVAALLYEEAQAQFLRGMYPCAEKHFVQMGAIVAHRLYGSEWPQSMDAGLLSHILPRHLIPTARTEARAFAALVAKLRTAHRQLGTLSPPQLQQQFLALCWTLSVYGGTFFRAYMLMSKPLRGNLHIHVGLNDWGMCVLNAATHKQVAAIELAKLDVKFAPNTNFLEVASRKRDFVATVTTPQAMLINNLLKQLKLKVQAAKGGAAQ